MEELIECCHECLALHDGISQDAFVDTMMEQYGPEVVDALGTDEVRIINKLKEIYKNVSAL